MTAERTSSFLMANLGAEVSRFLADRARGDDETSSASLARARGIIDKLFSHPEMIGRTGELTTLRAVLDDIMSGSRQFLVSTADLEEYFMPFAMRELKNRGIVEK